MEIVIDKQTEFEYKVCRIFKFNRVNSTILQRKGSEQMIIDDFDDTTMLSGSIAYKNNKEILLISTKDSEVNHISEITFKMIKILIKTYCTKNMHKVIFATNLPIEIHSEKAKELKKDFNFHIENIGYSFCLKNNLQFTSMY